jgi:hypothetical protein
MPSLCPYDVEFTDCINEVNIPKTWKTQYIHQQGEKNAPMIKDWRTAANKETSAESLEYKISSRLLSKDVLERNEFVIRAWGLPSAASSRPHALHWRAHWCTPLHAKLDCPSPLPLDSPEQPLVPILCWKEETSPEAFSDYNMGAVQNPVSQLH